MEQVNIFVYLDGNSLEKGFYKTEIVLSANESGLDTREMLHDMLLSVQNSLAFKHSLTSNFPLIKTAPFRSVNDTGSPT